MTRQQFFVRDRLRTLHDFGIAAEAYFDYRNPRRNPHTLDCVLLSFVLRGDGIHILGEEDFPESPGYLSVTHYGQVHDIVTTGASMDVLNLYLDPERHALPRVPESLRPVLQSLVPIHPNLHHRMNRRIRVRVENPEPLANLLLPLCEETARAAPGQRAIMEALTTACLIHLCRAALAFGIDAATGSENSPVEEIRRYLDRHFSSETSLADLAERANLSETALCRAFRAATGRTLVEYRNQRRIESVAQGLRNSDQKVQVLAMNAGFRDLAHFNRLFRRYMDCSPRVYRDRWRV